MTIEVEDHSDPFKTYGTAWRFELITGKERESIPQAIQLAEDWRRRGYEVRIVRHAKDEIMLGVKNRPVGM